MSMYIKILISIFMLAGLVFYNKKKRAINELWKLWRFEHHINDSGDMY